MIYAGIDFSMNSPSICTWDSRTELKFSNCRFFNYANWARSKDLEGQHKNISIVRQKSYTCNEERFRNISVWLEAVILSENVGKVSLEGYSYGSVGNTFEIGEATGVAKQTLFKHQIPFEIIEPTTSKMVWGGKGNAKKDLLYEKFVESEQVYLESLLGYDLINDPRVEKKLETPWELKPIDDLIDSFFIMKSHAEIRKMLNV